MDKSYVSMEQKMCQVCGKLHNHDCGVLLDRRMKDSMESYTTTGYGLCEEHQDLYDNDYIALVEIDGGKSECNEDGTVSIENAYRTGVVIHVKKTACSNIFHTLPNLPMVFIDRNTTERIRELTNESVE